LVAILNKVGNPANTGAILRTAEAAGVDAVLATEGTADIFSPKSLRASMGSAFRLCVIQKISFGQAIEECRTGGLEVIGTAPGADLSYTQVDWTNPSAIVLGSEAFGLDRDELNRLDRTVTVPMNPLVESLNVAATAAIIFFEAARQIRGTYR
jgi:TrmH family RNA methyltransferase